MLIPIKLIVVDIICNNRTTYTGIRESDGHQYVFEFTIAKYCVTKASIQPEGHQVFCGEC